MNYERIPYASTLKILKKLNFQALVEFIKVSKGCRALIFRQDFLSFFKAAYMKFLEENPDNRRRVIIEALRLLGEEPAPGEDLNERSDAKILLDLFFKRYICKGHIFDLAKLPYESQQKIIEKMEFPNMVKIVKASAFSKSLLERNNRTAFAKANNEFIAIKSDGLMAGIDMAQEARREALSQMRQDPSSASDPKNVFVAMKASCDIALFRTKLSDFSSKIINT